jgi:hypothetical protein
MVVKLGYLDIKYHVRALLNWLDQPYVHTNVLFWSIALSLQMVPMKHEGMLDKKGIMICIIENIIMDLFEDIKIYISWVN